MRATTCEFILGPAAVVLMLLAVTLGPALAWYLLGKLTRPGTGRDGDPYQFRRTPFVVIAIPGPLAVLVLGVAAGAGGPGRASWPKVVLLSGLTAAWLFLLWLATSARPRYLVIDPSGSPEVTLARWRRLLFAALVPGGFAAIAGAQWISGAWGRESLPVIVGSVIIAWLLYRALGYRVTITARGLTETGGFYRKRTVEWNAVTELNGVELNGIGRFLLWVHSGERSLRLGSSSDGFPGVAAALLGHLHECGTVSAGTREALEAYARLAPSSTTERGSGRATG